MSLQTQPQNKTKSIKNYSSILANVNHRNWLDDSPPLKCVNAYLDNNAVGGMTQQEHDDNLAALRRAAEVDQFIFNEEKSQYNCTETSLLGYRVGGRVIKPDPQRVQALQDLQMPTTKKELQRILGLFA